MHEHLARRTGSDRLAHFTNLANDALSAGGRTITTFAGHDISDAENYQRQRGGGAIYNVAIHRQVGLRSINKKQRTDDERRDAAQTEDSVAGDKGFRDQ